MDEETIRDSNLLQETRINLRATKNETEEKKLRKWMQFKHFFATHDVMEYGNKFYYIRADRTKRNLMNKGLIRKLTKQEKKDRGYNCKDAVYEYIGDNPTKVENTGQLLLV